MGLSSSQARLLHLTSRMHQIEYNTAKLEAQKLQMANESRRVYQEYQEALEATKIQYKSMNEDASITFRDATMNALHNCLVNDKSIYSGETSAKPLFLEGINDGKIYITPAIAEQYGLSETEQVSMGIEEYLIDRGCSMSKRDVIVGYEPDIPGELQNFVPISNQVTEPIAEIAPTITPGVTTPENCQKIPNTIIEGRQQILALTPIENRAFLNDFYSDDFQLDVNGNSWVKNNPIRNTISIDNVNSFDINSVSSFEAGKTYVINDKNGY